MKWIRIVLTASMSVATLEMWPPAALAEPPATSLETRECGFLGLEKWVFAEWRDVAQSNPVSRKVDGFDYREIRLEAADGRRLFGYRVEQPDGEENKRALLIGQGNATLIDQLADEMAYFASNGYVVFGFDYRGYGKSDGITTLRAVREDYRTILAHLKSQDFDKVFGYGMSFGGIVLLAASDLASDFDALVIDSTPSKLPWYALCPRSYDPIENIPGDTSKLMVISGRNDRVVPAGQVRELSDAVRRQGGRSEVTDFGHPLMDSNTRRRFQIVTSFLGSF